MDDFVRAIIFGIVQGLTEFLPVSSSGHLEISKYLLGDDSVARQSMMMTVVLHFATALSTIVIFRMEIVEIFRGLVKPSEGNSERMFCVKIVLSMIPAAAVGILFNDQIEALFGRDMLLVGIMLLLTGALLLMADRAKTTEKDVSVVDSIIVGISQAIAILPGISRSGATISTSVLLGIDRVKAAKFSFLMVVPLIFGKMAKDVLSAIKDGVPLAESGETMPLIVGFVAAFTTGLLACVWMIRLVKACQL
ncbi:UNVERIFIED_CONTAM: hypothetical protein GTU68_019038, partial [Idotea baltica]|nr:hypothetical protein [Idotea baltica]